MVGPAEHPADGACGRASGVVGSPHPGLGETVVIKLSIETSRRPDEGPAVVVGQSVHVAVGERADVPPCDEAVVAIVANARTGIEVSSEHRRIGAHAHAVIVLRHLAVGIVQQRVADIIHVLTVRLAVVPRALSLGGANANAFAEPVGIGRHIALVVDDLFHLVLHIGDALDRETPHEHLGVVVVAFQLSEPDVGAAPVHGTWRDIGIVAHQQYKTQILRGIIVMIENERLDGIIAIATCVSKAIHRSRTA